MKRNIMFIISIYRTKLLFITTCIRNDYFIVICESILGVSQSLSAESYNGRSNKLAEATSKQRCILRHLNIIVTVKRNGLLDLDFLLQTLYATK